MTEKVVPVNLETIGAAIDAGRQEPAANRGCEMSDDRRTTPGAGGAGHISGVGFAPFNNDAPKPAIPKQAVEAKEIKRAIEDFIASPEISRQYRGDLVVGFEMRRDLPSRPLQTGIWFSAKAVETILASLVGVKCTEDVAQEERAEIAKFIGWFGRCMNLKGKLKAAITTHDLSIMVARGDRAPVDVESIDPKWPVRPEADTILALLHTGQPQEGDASVAWRIESYLNKIKEADRDDQPGRVVQLEMTLAGIIRNEWPTIKFALSAAPASPQRAEEGDANAIIQNYRAVVAQCRDLLVRAEAFETCVLPAPPVIAKPKAQQPGPPKGWTPDYSYMGSNGNE